MESSAGSTAWDSEGDGIADPIREGSMDYCINLAAVKASNRKTCLYIVPNANDQGTWGVFDVPPRNALVLKVDEKRNVTVLRSESGRWSGYYTDLVTEEELITYAARRGQTGKPNPDARCVNTKGSVPNGTH